MGQLNVERIAGLHEFTQLSVELRQEAGLSLSPRQVLCGLASSEGQGSVFTNQEGIPGLARTMAQGLVLWIIIRGGIFFTQAGVARGRIVKEPQCLLSLFPCSQPGSGEPQTPEHEVIL